MEAPLKQSPLYHVLNQLGASFDAYHGWQMASCFTSQNEEEEILKSAVGISDVSWLGKLELKGSQRELDALAIPEGQVWKLARGHSLALCDPAKSNEICDSVEQQSARNHDGNAGGANLSAPPNASNYVRPEPVEGPPPEPAAGPSDHGSTGSPRTGASPAPQDQEISMSSGCVHLINVTSTYAGILLAGPHSRDVLQRLTAPNVSNAALPGGTCLSARVAGLHTRVVRDDLDETLAYWLFVGTEYAAYAWEAIMHTGIQFGMTPVGYAAVQGMRRGDG